MSQATPQKRVREACGDISSNHGSVAGKSEARQPSAEQRANSSAEHTVLETAARSASAERVAQACQWPAGSDPSVLHRDVITTADELSELLKNRRDDSTTIFVASGPWACDKTAGCLADCAALEGLQAADACVSAFFVDVDAVVEATSLLNITTSELPSAHVFHHDPTAPAGESAVKRAQKLPKSAIDFVSLFSLEPVHGLAHLHRRLERAQSSAPQNAHTNFVVVYSGAVWCPPCCRIMPQIRGMISDLNAAVRDKGINVSVVKADRDSSGTVDQVYDVKLIPTFQVFKASDAVDASVAAHDAITSLPPSPPAVVDDDAAAAAWAEALAAARSVAVKPLGALQNSKRETVFPFLERHCAPLTFDDDF